MKKIVVASSKGGVGKTTVALGIAGALSEKGKNVLLCDLDFENRCLDLFMGIENISLYDIGDVARGTVPPEKAMIKNDRGLSFVAAPADVSIGHGDNDISPDSLIKALDAVGEASGADFLICDTAAGHTVPEILAKSFADKAIIVASHQPTSHRGAARMKQILEDSGLSDTGLVITAFEFKETLKEARAGIFETIDSSGVQLLGVVPYDRRLMLSHEKGVMVPVGSDADIAFSNIAARLCGEKVKLFERLKGIKKKKVI